MSIILAQNLVRTGKSVEEAAKIAGVGEEMLRGLLGLPKKETKPEASINRTKETKGVKEESKNPKIKVAPEAIQSPKQASKKEKKPKKRNLITEWCEKYPDCFSRENPKPLKIGIHKDIVAEMGDASLEGEISQALKKYVSKDVYLEARKAGGSRYDLEGKESGEVSEEHRVDAEKWLERRAALKEARKQEKDEQQAEVS